VAAHLARASDRSARFVVLSRTRESIGAGIFPSPELRRILKAVLSGSGREEVTMRIELTRIQARWSEVEAIVDRAPALHVNEIVLLQIKYGGRDLMTVNEGGLRWAKVADLQAYVAACRHALEQGEALLNGLRRPEPVPETGAPQT
jgi:hypothetical protein